MCTHWRRANIIHILIKYYYISVQLVCLINTIKVKKPLKINRLKIYSSFLKI